MADRDWEKELADIDKRIAATPAQPVAATPAPVGRDAKRVPPARETTVAPPAVAPTRRHWTATAGLFIRLLVAAVLLASVIVWPYETRCGAWLAGYLAVIGLTALSALWTAAAAWRHRGAVVHVAALGIFATASVYAAREVLPRVGYALPDPLHPTIWACK